MGRDHWIGVDVGGTKVLAVELARTGADATPTRVVQRPMPGRDASEEAVEDVVVDAVRELAEGRRVDSVGVSLAGLVDIDSGVFRFGAHVPWRDAPVRARLEERLPGSRVVIDNDAKCAAHAELVAGTARGHANALMVTIGTGIGGAIMLDGKVVRGAQGFAGEFGHMRVVPDGRPCECGLNGCWEQYCSGSALERAVRLTLGPDVDGLEVSRLALAGDQAARDAITHIGEWLGIGLAGLVSAFDPSMVVIGGGVSREGDLILRPARATLARSIQGVEHRLLPEVETARFGDVASAVGAALLAAR